ncbi:MAG: radical SAM protein [Pseudomonadota bacterium]
MTAPHILFVNLPTVPLQDVVDAFARENMRSQSISMPLGILYLSSSLKAGRPPSRVGLIDYVTALHDVSRFRHLDDFITETALMSSPDPPEVLAFSLIFSASYHFFRRCLELLKKAWPKAMTLVGGVHASNTIHHLLKIPAIDYVAVGEAERAMPEFVEQLSLGRGPDVKGIYGRGQVPRSEHPEHCEEVPDLDLLPFPDWDLVDMERYVTSIGRERSLGPVKRHASIMTGRGCRFRCTYCSAHTVHGRIVRRRASENVVREMRALYERYGVTLFIPEDDLFNSDKGRLSALLSGMRSAAIPGLELHFPNGLASNLLDEEIIDDLRATGMRVLTLAVESGSPYVQRRIIRKNVNLTKTRRLVAYARRKGIIVRCFFVFGFPGETDEQMRQTIRYAAELGADWNVPHIAVPLVGSEMYDQFVAMGVVRDHPDTWAGTVFDERSFDTPEISGAALTDLVYRANLELNFLRNVNMVEGNFHTAIELFEDILTKHPFHVVAAYCIIECYRRLGDTEGMERAESRLRELRRKDVRAARMYEKYRDLMPGIQFDPTP